MSKSMDRETWSGNLGAYRKVSDESMVLATLLSLDALLHFNECGDVIRLNEFLEAIPENYGRRAAFVKWAADHAPLGMKEKKFIKDKAKAEKLGWNNPDGEVKAAMFKAAQEKDFWDYVPAPAVAIVTAEDAVDGVYSLIARIRKVSDTKHPTAGALAMAAKLEAFAATLRPDADAEKAAALLAAAKAKQEEQKPVETPAAAPETPAQTDGDGGSSIVQPEVIPAAA